MKALVSTEGQTAAVKDVPTPELSAGEILVKTTYVAQNPTDWKAVAVVPPGRIIGCDFAGVVADPNGSHWRKDQRVAGFVQGTAIEPTRGAFAEYVAIESSLVYAIPDKVKDQEAATIPLAFATAAQAIFQRLELPEPGKGKSADPVLIYGGATSVGKYAIQLAKLAGLFVVTTGSKKNHEFLTSLGADATIDYNNQNWPEEVRKITHDGLQHALDCIAENGTPQQVAKAMSPTKSSHIVTILPAVIVRDEVTSINKHIKIESTIVYTVFERELAGFSSFMDNCGPKTPQDKAFWEKWLGMLPTLLERGELKPNRVKEMGGIDDILKGFQEQQAGKVSAEKLVYKIA